MIAMMKRSDRACPDCRSPARGNPCWYYIDHPDSGGDPPCFDHVYTRDADRRERRLGRARWLWLTVAAAVILLAMLYAAHARDDGRHANSPIKDWVRGLKDKLGNGCCDTSDGYPADVEWDTDHDRYKVRIDGVWYLVPPDAVLTEPNKLGYSMVWYWRKDGVPQIRCFIPGAGG